MDKILLGVFVEGVPTELIGDLVELTCPEVGGFFDGEGGEVVMCAGGENAVEPGLFVFVAGGGEGCAGEFFGVETEGGFLGRVAVGWKGIYVQSISRHDQRLGCLFEDEGMRVVWVRGYLLPLRFHDSC